VSIQDLGGLVQYAGGIATALIAIGGVAYAVVVRPLKRWFTKLVDERLQPQLATANEQLDSAQGKLSGIEAEVTNNHGSSMKDAVQRVEQQTARLETTVTTLAHQLTSHITNHPGGAG
jgi:replicative DNA helicase